MSSATAALRQYAVPCPACGAVMALEEGGPETDRRTCADCDSPLVIVRTDTLFMASIPRQRTGGPVAGADAISDFWGALRLRDRLQAQEHDFTGAGARLTCGGLGEQEGGSARRARGRRAGRPGRGWHRS